MLSSQPLLAHATANLRISTQHPQNSPQFSSNSSPSNRLSSSRSSASLLRSSPHLGATNHNINKSPIVGPSHPYRTASPLNVDASMRSSSSRLGGSPATSGLSSSTFTFQVPSTTPSRRTLSASEILRHFGRENSDDDITDVIGGSESSDPSSYSSKVLEEEVAVLGPAFGALDKQRREQQMQVSSHCRYFSMMNNCFHHAIVCPLSLVKNFNDVPFIPLTVFYFSSKS
jgi:hypothetical protein